MDRIVEQQKQHFESISEKYFNARQNENHLEFKRLMWDLFFKKINSVLMKDKYTCLEAMCGYAEGYKILNQYTSLKLEYTGFDYSQELVRIANEIYPDLKIIHGNILNYTDKNKYDLVILLGGLHHVYSNVEKALQNINKLTEQGTLFINLEPTHNNWFFRKTRERIYKKNELFDCESEQGFELKELNSLFNSNGYEQIYQMYPGLIGYVLYYNPDAFEKLNIGTRFLVNAIFSIEKYFYTNFIGKYFSFATLTLWRKK